MPERRVYSQKNTLTLLKLFDLVRLGEDLGVNEDVSGRHVDLDMGKFE